MSELFKHDMEISFQFKHFDELSKFELYDLLKLRTDVFVVEQNCPYPELDQKDLAAFHCLCLKNNHLIGTARIFGKGLVYQECAIGRFVLDQNQRANGYGHLMMEQCIQFIEKEFKTAEIRISAQEHLKDFYGKHGFKVVSEIYLEDNIPHVEMLK